MSFSVCDPSRGSCDFFICAMLGKYSQFERTCLAQFVCFLCLSALSELGTFVVFCGSDADLSGRGYKLEHPGVMRSHHHVNAVRSRRVGERILLLESSSANFGVFSISVPCRP